MGNLSYDPFYSSHFLKGSFCAETRPSFLPTPPLQKLMLGPCKVHFPELLEVSTSQANKICSCFEVELSLFYHFPSLTHFLYLVQKPGGSSLTRPLPLPGAFTHSHFSSFLNLAKGGPLSKLTMAEL